MPSKGEKRMRSLINQSLKYHSLDDFPGFCYFALLPDGCIKIGYSNTDDLVKSRMKSLSRQYQAPVIPLAVIKGGFVAEAHMHERFEAYRLPGDGERFTYSPEMAEYIASLV
ncbi:T5orf172 domain [Mycobacteroides abscessus subsp. massiliense]|nr:GIY-YIG nuclease family protein [Mycobacteroides abscessus subsp. massiliense]SKM98044.1 T5orf172 domain [Mycobacteroides abscessus subsp. massiliense]